MFRYMEAMHLSYRQAAVETPWAEIERAFHIWELDEKKREMDKLRNTPL